MVEGPYNVLRRPGTVDLPDPGLPDLVVAPTREAAVKLCRQWGLPESAARGYRSGADWLRGRQGVSFVADRPFEAHPRHAAEFRENAEIAQAVQLVRTAGRFARLTDLRGHR